MFLIKNPPFFLSYARHHHRIYEEDEEEEKSIVAGTQFTATHKVFFPLSLLTLYFFHPIYLLIFPLANFFINFFLPSWFIKITSKKDNFNFKNALLTTNLESDCKTHHSCIRCLLIKIAAATLKRQNLWHRNFLHYFLACIKWLSVWDSKLNINATVAAASTSFSNNF